jgi:CBS-domain-containing membrane protein
MFPVTVEVHVVLVVNVVTNPRVLPWSTFMGNVALAVVGITGEAGV